MKIICGTDFSSNANAAALAATTLAAKLELPVTLVHVINPSNYVDSSQDLLGHLRSTRQKKLQALAERAGRRGAIVETVILEGSPALKLSEFAAKSGAQFLVVSAVGHIAPTKWLAGSVTDQAVQASSVPTLVIRDPSSFEAWLHEKRKLKVMVGYDFSRSSDAAIRWITSLDAISPSDITVAYVASPANERARLGIAAPLSPLYYPSALRRFLEKEIEEKTGGVIGRKPHISVKADWGRPDSQLIEMARDNGTDLLVVGTSQRRGLARLGSVARAAMHYSHGNVASVPEDWRASESTILPGWNDSIPSRADWVSKPPENKYATTQR